MGAMCGKKPVDKPKNLENKEEHKVQEDEKKNQEHKNEEVKHEVKEEKKDEHELQSVPKPVEEHGETDEDRRKLVEQCLEYVNDVPREGSIQNINQDVEVVAVKKDLNFE